MSYRTFSQPMARHTVLDWRDWAVENGLYIPLKHPQVSACDKCRGAMWPDDTWDTCFDCNHDRLSGVVPVSYSVSTGLEAAVYRAKNSVDHKWLNIVLASMLSTFLHDHLPCIERRFGHIDVFTMVPSHYEARGGWDHMREVHASVTSWPQYWDNDLLVKTVSDDAPSRRNEALDGLFEVRAGADVQGLRVAIVDDTFTSGGTMRSAALALVAAGAKKPVAIPIGRQVNLQRDKSQALIADLAENQKAWDYDQCVVHNRPRMFTM